jgi:hypothetical protein
VTHPEAPPRRCPNRLSGRRARERPRRGILRGRAVRQAGHLFHVAGRDLARVHPPVGQLPPLHRDEGEKLCEFIVRRRPRGAEKEGVVAAAGVVAPFDCYVQVPGGAEPDVNDTELMARLEDRNYEGWFGAQMVGSECVLELRVNSCNIAAVRNNTLNPGTTEGLDCQLRGDMRFSLLSYVDQPGTPFLGVAQFRADPVTGEVLSTDANIGGPALQSVRTRAMQAFDLINGRFTDQEFFTGEDIRAYLEAANRVDLPAPPRIDFSVATGVPGLAASADPGVRAEIQRTMDRAAARAEALQGLEGRTRIYSDRLSTLRGSDLEQRLFDNDEIFVLAGMANLPEHGSPSALRASLLDQVSPLGGGLERRIQESLAEETAMNAAGMHMVNEFTDDSVLWFVNQHRDWPRARVEFELNRRLYRQTEIHEMGHCLGLRHDFGASADTENYAPQYYRIAEQFPLPDPRDFETDGTPGYSVAESNAFERAYSGARRLRELAGIDAWMNSAIMEYTANWYQRIQGSGYQDWMAIALGYGGLVDIYHNEAGRPVDEVNSATTPRVYVQHYMGGELCSTDNDCPYSTGGSRSAELTEANRASGLTQSCIPNRSRAGQNVCSSFESDSSELRARVEDGAASAEWVPIYYRYCEDYRAGTRSLAWCNTFDEGDSYREMVRNSMEAYERNYIFRAFRRYRRLFGYNYADGVLRYLFPVVNIQQNLLYNYANNPEFRDTEGPFGFYDQFLSSADGLNFFARILGSPGVGAYNYNTGYRRYVRTNQDPAAPGADLAVPLVHALRATVDAARIGAPDEAAATVIAARAAGGRVIAVGTTSLRLLESAATPEGLIQPFHGDTAIFITPGYRFRAADVLMTNFHLPKSTLFMLVSAFAGQEVMREAYDHAIATGYRFYSYGDSSLLFRA